MTSYAQKSSATRAAKKLDPATFTIDQNEDGTWSINKKGQALQSFLADHDKEVKEKKAKALEIKARHKEEAAPVIPAAPNAPEIKGEEEASTHNPMAEADKIANAAVVNVDPAKPKLSTAEKPTKLVWHIADEMYDAAKAAGKAMPSRSEVMAECVKRGVAYGTARTQFQHWFKTLKDSQATPLATIGKDGRIIPPAK